MADSSEGQQTERKAPDHHAAGPQVAAPVLERAAGLDSPGLLGVGSSLTERLAGAQGRGNGPVRQAALQRMQRTHGNRAVQRFLQSHSAPAAPVTIQRTAATADPPATVDADTEAAPESEAPAGPDPEAQAELAQLGAGVGDYSGGGGGGGGAVPAPPKPAAPPDVSNAEPAAALGSLSALPPVALANSLGSVGGAINHTVGKEQADLAANPPQLERPGGPPTAA
ncbi:MAG: hypothetical protein M3Z04_18250, partial [Chloroflexota bacterium]|nr:hypothetical protein [Chloroflexota bacterium]